MLSVSSIVYSHFVRFYSVGVPVSAGSGCLIEEFSRFFYVIVLFSYQINIIPHLSGLIY